MIQQLKNEIEREFETLAHFIIRQYKKIIPIFIVTILALAANIYFIEFDASTESFLYEDDPERIAYNEMRNQFGRDEKIILSIKTQNIFDPKFLKELQSIHREIEEKVPYIKDVDSLINARKTTGNQDSLIVEDLMEPLPTTPEEIAKVKAYIDGSEMFKNLMISEDYSYTSIVVTTQTYSSLGVEKTTSTSSVDEFSEESSEFSGGTDDFADGASEFSDTTTTEDSSQKQLPFITFSENAKVIEALQAIVDEHSNNGLELHLAGMPVFTDGLIWTMLSNMLMFVAMVFITIAIMLRLMFGRKVGVILPLMVVGMSILATISLIVFAGIKITTMTAIVPSLLLAIGVGATVHLLAIFFKEFDEGKTKEESLVYAMGHSGFAIVLTSLTTAGSLASFALADVAPVAQMGIFASLGVVISLILTLVLLPAMLLKFDVKRVELHKSGNGKLDNVLAKLAKFSVTYPKSIVTVSLTIVAITLYLASNMKYEHNPLEWMNPNDPMRVGVELVDKELKGSVMLEAVIDTGVENGLYEPNVLLAIDRAAERIKTLGNEEVYIGKTISLSMILKEINKALNENNPDYYKIPDTKEMVAQEFLLFENSGSDDLDAIVNSQFSKTKLTIKLPWVDAVKYASLLKDAEKVLHEELGDMAEVKITGMVPMMVRTVTAALYSLGDSYFVAFGFIAILMIFVLGNLKLGLLSMIPNIAPIVFGVAAMLLLDMNLDMFTVLIGAIAMGLAVDDTIHFMHNYKRYHHMEGSVDKAIALTFHSTGRAMLVTTIVLATGFFIYTFSEMTNLYNFGLITGIVIIVALLSDFLMVPALLKLVEKDEVEKD
jgi:predicted RND superfamily exporter protein